MINNLNLDKCNELLKNFYELTHIRTILLDEAFHEQLSFPPCIPPICKIIQSDPHAQKRCFQDNIFFLKHNLERTKPLTFHCHAGLTLSIVPLLNNGAVIGYLMLCHMLSFSCHEKAFYILSKKCNNYTINKSHLHNTCQKSNLISESYISAASHILQTIGIYLCLEATDSSSEKQLAFLIDEYISNNLSNELSADIICNQFKIGRTKLYKIIKTSYNSGVAQHIRHLRIERAKKLLVIYPEMTIYDISEKCGFNDYNYFINVFSKATGFSPKKFRDIHISLKQKESG